MPSRGTKWCTVIHAQISPRSANQQFSNEKKKKKKEFVAVRGMKLIRGIVVTISTHSLGFVRPQVVIMRAAQSCNDAIFPKCVTCN